MTLYFCYENKSLETSILTQNLTKRPHNLTEKLGHGSFVKFASKKFVKVLYHLFKFSNLPESRAAAADGGGLSWIGGGLSYLGGGLSYTAGGGLSRITGGAGGAACLDLTLDGADDGFLKKENRFFTTQTLFNETSKLPKSSSR